MATVDGGALVVGALAEHGVRYLFCINGGHVFLTLAHLREHGIQLLHMRHEQATAYAADGWARSDRSAGSGGARRGRAPRSPRARGTSRTPCTAPS